MNDFLVPTARQIAEGATLTPEDLSRSHDRMRVLQARQTSQQPKLLWLLTGPGILVMLGENDGPSMLSYAASGATYGIGFFLPFIVATFLADNVSHGLPTVTGFTRSFVLEAAFLAIAVLAGLLVPEARRALAATPAEPEFAVSQEVA